MTSFLQTLFSWPNGIVVGNLIASGICVAIAAIHLDRLARKHHNHNNANFRQYHERLWHVEKRLGNLMPYEIRGPNTDGKYEVVNKDSGAVKAQHATKEDAERQVRLLHAVENDPNWEPTHNG